MVYLGLEYGGGKSTERRTARTTTPRHKGAAQKHGESKARVAVSGIKDTSIEGKKGKKKKKRDCVCLRLKLKEKSWS